MLVVSDEVYEKIVFDGNEHFSLASRPEFRDSVVTVNSFSKTYAMTGWRVGYVIANEPITTSIRKIHGYMVSCAPSDAQRAALEALVGPQDCVNEMVGEYATRRDRIVKGLNEVEGFRCVAPKGTFYAFPDVSRLNIPSAEIANKLLEEAKVASIPGSAFGAAGEGYLRFSFAPSQQNIEEGMATAFDPNFPFQDIGKVDVTRPIGSAMEEIAGGISPVFKTPVELLLNKELFTGKPIEYSSMDMRDVPPVMQVMMPLLPEGLRQALSIVQDEYGTWRAPAKWVYAIASLVPISRTGQSIQQELSEGTPEWKRKQIPSTILSRMAGVKARPVDLEYYREEALRKRLQELTEANALAREYGPR
jgi:hypothetical protein